MHPRSGSKRRTRVLFAIAIAGLGGIAGLWILVRSRPMASDEDFARVAQRIEAVRSTAGACPGAADGTRGEGTAALEALLAPRGPWASCLERSRAIAVAIEEEGASNVIETPAPESETDVLATCGELSARAEELARLPGLCTPFPVGVAADLQDFLRFRGLVAFWSLAARDEARRGLHQQAIERLLVILGVLRRTLDGVPQAVAASLVATDMAQISAQLASLLAAPSLDRERLEAAQAEIERLAASIPNPIRLQREAELLLFDSALHIPSTASTEGDMDAVVWLILDQDRRFDTLPCDGQDDHACALGYVDATREADALLEHGASGWMRAFSPRLVEAQQLSAMTSGGYLTSFWRFLRLRQVLRATAVALMHRRASSTEDCVSLEVLRRDIDPSWDLELTHDEDLLRIESPWLARSPVPALLLEVRCPRATVGS